MVGLYKVGGRRKKDITQVEQLVTSAGFLIVEKYEHKK